jgi:hypothetical protein
LVGEVAGRIVVDVEEEAVDVVLDDVRDAAGVEGGDGDAAGHGFDEDEAEAFAAGGE